MEYILHLYQRPNFPIIAEILEIVNLLTPEWFTPNVPDDTRRDLLFQDVLCLRQDGKLVAFLVFTSWDGSLHITLMGTHPDYRGKGLGFMRMHPFFVSCETSRV